MSKSPIIAVQGCRSVSVLPLDEVHPETESGPLKNRGMECLFLAMIAGLSLGITVDELKARLLEHLATFAENREEDLPPCLPVQLRAGLHGNMEGYMNRLGAYKLTILSPSYKGSFEEGMMIINLFGSKVNFLRETRRKGYYHPVGSFQGSQFPSFAHEHGHFRALKVSDDISPIIGNDDPNLIFFCSVCGDGKPKSELDLEFDINLLRKSYGMELGPLACVGSKEVLKALEARKVMKYITISVIGSEPAEAEILAHMISELTEKHSGKFRTETMNGNIQNVIIPCLGGFSDSSKVNKYSNSVFKNKKSVYNSGLSDINPRRLSRIRSFKRDTKSNLMELTKFIEASQAEFSRDESALEPDVRIQELKFRFHNHTAPICGLNQVGNDREDELNFSYDHLSGGSTDFSRFEISENDRPIIRCPKIGCQCGFLHSMDGILVHEASGQEDLDKKPS